MSATDQTEQDRSKDCFLLMHLAVDAPEIVQVFNNEVPLPKQTDLWKLWQFVKANALAGEFGAGYGGGGM